MKRESALKWKKRMRDLLLALGIFALLTIAATLLDEGWWAKTTASGKSMAGWAVGGLFGAGLLLYLGKGCVALWYILVVRFLISRAERFALLGLFLGGVALFAAEGLVDSSAGLGAALLLGALLALGLFWLWRQVRGIARRILRGGRFENLSNLEYFAVLGAALACTALFFLLDPQWDVSEDFVLLVLAAFLLFLVNASILYWVWIGIKALLRLKNQPEEEFSIAGDELVFYGAARTVRIPLDEIVKAERVEAYTGISGIPTLLVPAHTRTLLSLSLADGKTVVRLSMPDEAFCRELRARMGNVWAADAVKSE